MYSYSNDSAKSSDIDFFHVFLNYTHILHDYFLVVNRFA